jgi:hypothetical protein
MTSTSPTPPDLSTLSLNAQPSQRPHDSYDYDSLSGSNLRQQYHFSTSPIVPGQMPFNPLNVNQTSPLKAKSPPRGGLPAVRFRSNFWPFDYLSCHSTLTLFRFPLAMVGLATVSDGCTINVSSYRL